MAMNFTMVKYAFVKSGHGTYIVKGKSEDNVKRLLRAGCF